MCVHFEFKNEKLKKLVEKKAEELDISVDRLVYNYINRGLMDDCRDEDVFHEVHSEEFLRQVDEALSVD